MMHSRSFYFLSFDCIKIGQLIENHIFSCLKEKREKNGLHWFFQLGTFYLERSFERGVNTFKMSLRISRASERIHQYTSSTYIDILLSNC